MCAPVKSLCKLKLLISSNLGQHFIFKALIILFSKVGATAEVDTAEEVTEVVATEVAVEVMEEEAVATAEEDMVE